MTKEQFISKVEIIEKFIEQQRIAGDTIRNLFFTESTASAFDFGNDLIELAIEQLSELSGIHQESLEWYIYGSGGKCIHSDGFTMDVRTMEDFWKFETHVIK